MFVPKKYLSLLKRTAGKYLRFYKWKMQLKGHVSRVCPNSKLLPHGKILVIAPHADDELIGCHSLMKQRRKDVIVLYCQFLGNNVSEENKKIRGDEFRSYMKLMGLEYVVSSPDELLNTLSFLFATYNFSAVFLPSIVDWHAQHRETNMILLKSYDNHPAEFMVGWYQVSISIPFEFVNFAVPMSYVEHKKKWKTFKKIYKSQLHMNVDRFKYVESIHRNEKNEICESYILLDVENWRKILMQKRINEDELDNLEKNLNDLPKMITEARNLYRKIICDSVG